MRRLPTYWYPVDPAAKVIYDQPRRYRWQIYELAGIDVSGPWQRLRPAVLGWPERSLTEAMVLAALSSGRPDHSKMEWMFRNDVAELCTRLRLRVPHGRDVTRVIVRLTHKGLIWRRVRKGWVKRIRLDVEPRPVCPIVPLRGRDLGAETYDDFDMAGECPAAMTEGSAA